MYKKHSFLMIFVIAFAVLLTNCSSSTQSVPLSKPEIVASPPNEVESGRPVVLKASAEGEDVKFEWDAKGHGKFDTTFGSPVTWTAPIVTTPQQHPIYVKATDQNGQITRNFTTIMVLPPSSNTLTGKGRDETYGPVPDMQVILFDTTRETPLDTVYTDNLGDYAFSVRSGAYHVFGHAVIGTKYVSNQIKNEDSIVVLPNQKISHDIDGKLGYYSKLSNISLNGAGDSVNVLPGAMVNLKFDYTVWNRKGCSNCTSQLLIGIKHKVADYIALGKPRQPGISASASLNLKAPLENGVYRLYARMIPQASINKAIDAYETQFPDPYRYIPVGTITVSASGSQKER